MGYRALKERSENKYKVFKQVMLCIFVFLMVVAVVFACVVPPESWKYYFHLPDVGKRQAGELRIHFIDVGQGDCTLIELPDGKVMLIDGGNDQSKTKKSVLRYLNALDIDVIDHLVITHKDGDHCGSLEEVFRYKEVVNAYMPLTFYSNELEFAEVYAAAVEEGCAMVAPSRELNWSQSEGDVPYVLAMLHPYGAEVGETNGGGNDDSAVVWLDYFGSSALFCGDISSEVEETLISHDRLGYFSGRKVSLASTEILKVAHHGSKASSSQAWLNYLNVENAVVSCGRDNAYGHPASATLDRLALAKATVYRTDRQGHIVATLKKDGSYSIRTIASD